MKISVIKCVKKVIEEFSEEVRGTLAAPAAHHLFQIRDEKEAKVLPKEQAVGSDVLSCHGHGATVTVIYVFTSKTQH